MIEIPETDNSLPFTVSIDNDGYADIRDPVTGRIECDREQALHLAAALYHFANTGELPE